jgi:hypothetical protein
MSPPLSAEEYRSLLVRCREIIMPFIHQNYSGRIRVPRPKEIIPAVQGYIRSMISEEYPFDIILDAIAAELLDVIAIDLEFIDFNDFPGD